MIIQVQYAVVPACSVGQHSVFHVVQTRLPRKPICTVNMGICVCVYIKKYQYPNHQLLCRLYLREQIKLLDRTYYENINNVNSEGIKNTTHI